MISNSTKTKERLLALEFISRMWAEDIDLKISPLRSSIEVNNLDVSEAVVENDPHLSSKRASIETISSVLVQSKTNIREEFIERAPLIKILSMQSSNLLASELCTNIKRRGRPAGKAKSTAVKRKASNQTSPKKKLN